MLLFAMPAAVFAGKAGSSAGIRQNVGSIA